VLAAGGYPGKPRAGDVLEGITRPEDPDVLVFHAGTRLDGEGRLVTAGGRVLGVTARGKTFEEARARAYAAVAGIRFEGMHFRKDIGMRGPIARG